MLGSTLALGAGVAAGATATAMTGPRQAQAASSGVPGMSGAGFGLKSSASRDQTRLLQTAVDKAAELKQPLLLDTGTYRIKSLILREGTEIRGVPGQTSIVYMGGTSFVSADQAHNLRLDGLVLIGDGKALSPDRGADGLISARGCNGIALKNIEVRNSPLNGLSLRNCSGTISDIICAHCANTGIFSLDSTGLDISHSEVSECGNNGIQIWQSKPAEDGSTISNCRVRNIKANSGGSGQNGNGINVFRAGAVTVNANRITDCAYSAIRGNAVSNVIMTNNHCARLGEVALYAEFGFDGALIAHNIVDGAATGISVTNFKEGGRLAIVQGNLVRNLKRRENDKDKRGTGIAVEADTAVSGNVIENAETLGLAIGWGTYMRDVCATGNLIRKSPIGIGIAADHDAGLVFVAHNMISGASNGAIRAMLFDKPTGPDLVRSSAESFRNFALIGNVAS